MIQADAQQHRIKILLPFLGCNTEKPRK